MSQSIEEIEAMDKFLKSKNLTVPTVAIDGSPALNLPRYEAYFDCSSKSFLVRNDRGDFIPATETQVKRELRRLGYPNKPQVDEVVSQVEDKMCEIHSSKDVKFSGAVAGHKVGLIDNNKDGRILITRGPAIIEPLSGDWPTIKEFMTSLFGELQVAYVYSWLKCSYRALASGEFTPGQALAIAGDTGNGKNFFQKHIVTPLLGGREGLPFRYMMGNPFNADIMGAEHWMISDEVSSTDIRARKSFGKRIKDIVSNENQSLHGKCKDAVIVQPFIRLTITVNPDNGNLTILPPIVGSLASKMMLLKSDRASNLPSQEERESFRKNIEGEMPAFVHFLMHDYVIPEDIRCEENRYGVIAYHHPELLDQLKATLPETRFDELVTDAVFEKRDTHVWTGSARRLESLLRERLGDREVDKIANWSPSVGIFLGNLSRDAETGKRYFRATIIKGIQQWKVCRNEVDQQPKDGGGLVVDTNHTSNYAVGA